MDTRDYSYLLAGHERVLHNVKAAEVLPKELDKLGRSKAFIVSSRTLNTKTDVVRNIQAALGDRHAGTTDKVGEHAPLGNILEAAAKLREADADIIIGIGGGSVIDFCKMLQLALSEEAFTKEELLKYVMQMDENHEPAFGSKAAPRIRQILIPTTLATAEWTLGCTPIDEETHLKATFLVPSGGPQVVVYDPDILSLTPEHLLVSTAIRGLDHAINSRCATLPHPLTDILSEQAIRLYIENLPIVKADRTNREALTNLQLATWYAGMCQMSVMHGFSHWMVHIVGPYANVSHSDAACVLMLAQARWLEGYADEQHGAIKKLIHREGESMYTILSGLLTTLGMPQTLDDLGIEDSKVEEMCGHAMQHPFVTQFNIRPITTLDDLKAVMSLAKKAA